MSDKKEIAQADKPENNRGRPEMISLDIIEEVCERIANGETLTRIAQDQHLPGRWTLTKWLAKGEGDMRDGNKSLYADFSHNYAHARECQTEIEFDEIKTILDDLPTGMWIEDEDGNKWKPTDFQEYKELCKKEGKPVPQYIVQGLTKEQIALAKERVQARQWVVARKAPKKYGNKVDMTLAGDIKRPIRTVDHSKLAEQLGKDGLRELLANMAAAQRDNDE